MKQRRVVDLWHSCEHETEGSGTVDRVVNVRRILSCSDRTHDTALFYETPRSRFYQSEVNYRMAIVILKS